jgi:hypothetical protein
MLARQDQVLQLLYITSSEFQPIFLKPDAGKPHSDMGIHWSAFDAFSSPFHGILQAIGIIHILRVGQPPQADAVVTLVWKWRRGCLDDFPIADMRINPTAANTIGAAIGGKKVFFPQMR